MEMETNGDEPTNTLGDYITAIAWNLIGCDEHVVEYYDSMRQELRNILRDYGGLRLRDIKSFFEERTEAELDLNKLGIKSWRDFLLTAREDIKFMKDLDKDVVWVFIADTHASDYDALSASDYDGYNLQNLVTCEARKAFLDGYLNCANGIPMKDQHTPTSRSWSSSGSRKT